MVNNSEKTVKTNTTYPVTYLCHGCGRHFDWVDEDSSRDVDLFHEAVAAHREEDGCDAPDLFRVRPDQPCIGYVNAYVVDRCYGGSEEGGWYYDSGEPLASVPIRGVYRELRRFDGQPCLRPSYDEHRYSVLREELLELLGPEGPDFNIRVFTEPLMARPWPTRRPHYE